ncbi:MAG: DUF3127 domain-containing protein [Bacteroidales bacterium]|nr:DUF3127 domain-containing protein [Bacteroidales bacterium]
MANKISGRVIELTLTETLTSASGNLYTKREVVIERTIFDRNTGFPTTDSTDTPTFTLIGQNCNALDRAKIGDSITIHYDLQGRSYVKNGIKKYFTDIRVFNVELRDMPQPIANDEEGKTDTTFDTNNPYGLITPENLPKASSDQISASKLENDDLPF